MDYLGSPEVTKAYQAFVDRGSNKLSRRVAEILAKGDELPKLLGFTITGLGESAVLATISSSEQWEHLDTLKKLMAINPRQTADAVNLQVMVQRFTPLLALCANRGQPETFDWLMSNGADAFAREQRG